MGIGELSGKPDDIPCNGLVSHEGGGGEVVILLVAYAMEIRMTSDWVGQLAQVQTFPFFRCGWSVPF